MFFNGRKVLTVGNNQRIMKKTINKSFIGKLMLTFVLMLTAAQNIKAESTVYFFIDFRFWNSEYVFTVNGNKAFKLTPEGKTAIPGSDAMLYNMVMRKVVFKKADSYVVATDCPSKQGTYHAELNLNLEDGETYYVLLNSSMKRTFYMELLDEKDGRKMLKKAQGNKKYTVNEDFIYNGK